MKNTSFRRRYTKTSLKRIRVEYVKNLESKGPGRFLCHASPEFHSLWSNDEFRAQIIENVINLFGEYNNETQRGGYRGGNCLLYGHTDSVKNRIKFLDHEIARLSKK